MAWDLPVQAVIGGKQYDIATDYREILDIIEYLHSDEDEDTRSLVALHLFYENFQSMPVTHHQEAADYLSRFINCFDVSDDAPKPQQIDWKQDEIMIAAEVNKVAGCEVRSLPSLHWFTFIGYYHGVGEGQLSFVVSIRNKLRKGVRLEKHEQEFYSENPSKVDLVRRADTQESEKESQFWELFGE